MEKYITKEKDVLTRVTLHIENGNDYTIESIYSDESTLELGMLCIEAYLTDLGISRKEFGDTLDKIINKKKVSGKKRLNITSFSFIMEQYDKRNIVKSHNVFNTIPNLIACLKSCAVLTSWLPCTVDYFLEEYTEELIQSEKDGRV